MGVDANSAFTAMFYALDAAYEEFKAEDLRSFLSDANPFLFDDGSSADPAVYVGFENEWVLSFGNAEATFDESLGFVRTYLGSRNGMLLEAFDSIVDGSAWESVLS